MSIVGAIGTGISLVGQAADVGEDVFGGGGFGERVATAHEAIITGNWSALDQSNALELGSPQFATNLSRALSRAMGADSSIASRVRGFVDDKIQPQANAGPNPSTNLEYAAFAVWAALGGWGGPGSGLNPIESEAQSLVETALGNAVDLPKSSGESGSIVGDFLEGVEQGSQIITDVGQAAQQTGEQVQGGVTGAQAGVETTRRRQELQESGFGGMMPLLAVGAIGLGLFFGSK